jgi:hypothetical protein
MVDASGYSGIGSFIFVIDEPVFGGGRTGGTAAVPVAPTSADLHIPINPTETIEWERPTYEEYEVTLYGDSLPTRVSTNKAPGTLSLTGIYHAPFLLARAFGTSTSGVWDADGTATIDCTMTNYERIHKSMCMHIHLDNRDTDLGDIIENMYGGKITSYKWEIATGEVLKEIVELEFGNTTTDAIAMNPAATFHNGRFAVWDDNKLDINGNVAAIAQNQMTITTTTTIDACISSIDSASIELKLPHQTHIGIGYESQNFDAKNSYDVEAVITAKVIGNTFIEDLQKRVKSRLMCPVKFLITNSGTYQEYIECTKMVLTNIGSLTIPDAAGDAVLQVEMTFKAVAASVLTYHGTFQQTLVATPTAGYITQ